MKKKKHFATLNIFKVRAIAVLIVFTWGLSSCEKEEASDGTIEIFAEAMSGGNGKVLLDGATATWVSGDAIRINSTEVAVERRNDRAYISYNAAEDEVTRAVYPASLASGDLTGDNVTINFPAYYHYRTDASGHQLLDLPMAARSSGRNPLQFKHLTGALYITVTNTATVPLTLQSVTVSSNQYKLNGTKTIDLTQLEDVTYSYIGPLSTQAPSRFVTLLFDEGYTLTAGSSVRVMVPVMAAGGNGSNKNDFTISVKSYDTSQNFYLFSQSQNSGTDHVLHRNELGYAPVSITASGAGAILDQENGNYVVRNAMDFLLMTQNITSGTITGSSNIDILADIDMSGIPITSINNDAYVGTMNGNNHTISNLTINSRDIGSSYYICALFAKARTNIRIKNITFDNLSLCHEGTTNNTLKLGGLFGTLTSTSGTLTIDNCNINYDSINIAGANSSVYFGGLLCDVEGGQPTINISNCSTTHNITLNKQSFYWGGFIGSASSSHVSITNSSCTDTIKLTATSNIRAGGMIGNKAQGSFTATGCRVTGQMVMTAGGQYNYLASLIGRYTPYGSNTVTIANNDINMSISLGGSPITVVEYNN